MTTLSAGELARRLPDILAQLRNGGEEIVITQDGDPVARLVPDHGRSIDAEVLRNIAGTLSPEEAEDFLRDMEGFDPPLSEELKDPWA